MGHFHTTVRAVGKNREDAEDGAVSDFLYEHGLRHSLREVESAKLIRKVPPKKEVREERLTGSGYLARKMTYVTMVDNPDAPPEEWLEEWEFVLHTHA